MKSWLSSLKVYATPNVVALAFLGFSCGIPLCLVSSTFSIWLTEIGFTLTAIGLFGLVKLPYNIKFLWAPVVDKISIPVLTKRMGRRRSWGVVFQLFLLLSIAGMGLINPQEDITLAILFAFGISFFSASQDIIVDAWRIESISIDNQAAANSMYTFGYRLAMLVSGAGALFLATYLSWNLVYMLLALPVLVGIVAMLLVKEPEVSLAEVKKGSASFKEAVIMPLKDFITRDHWLLIFAFIFLYKMGEATLGAMANPFYIKIGFTKEEIATVIKLYGLIATILGGFVGGALCVKFGVMKMLLAGGILQAVSNLLFSWLAIEGPNVNYLIVTVGIDNLSAGFASVVFIAYLSSLCNKAYTATQYALLTSLVMVSRDVIASGSGWVADQVSWAVFFFITFLAAVPGIILLLIIMKKLPAPEAK